MEDAGTNRTWDEVAGVNGWKDPAFQGWADPKKGKTFIDDDILGFMRAAAGKDEGRAGPATIRRAVLESPVLLA